MPFVLPSIPYAPPERGYWSPVTSTLNWCEEDYYATGYIAEIVNTLTNLFYVALAIRSVRNCIQHEHDAVWLAAFIVLLFMGIGSFLFHATLKYEMQLLDELFMIYLSCTTFFAIFSHGKTRTTSAFILLFSISLAVFVTAYYHYLKDPLFHQNTFALLTATNIFRGWYDMEKLLRPSQRTKRASENKEHSQRDGTEKQEQIDSRDLRILNTMWTLSLSGVGLVGFAFLIWTLDNKFCPRIREWRRAVGLPWGMVLEGHGWWHFFSSIASHYILTWLVWLRYCLKGQHDEVELRWSSLLTSLPLLVRKDTSNGKGRSCD